MTSTDHSEELAAEGIDAEELLVLADRALAEDLGGGVDVTTVATVPPPTRSAPWTWSRGRREWWPGFRLQPWSWSVAARSRSN